MLLKLEFLLGPEGGRIEISTPVLFLFFVFFVWGGGGGGRGVLRMRHRVPELSV